MLSPNLSLCKYKIQNRNDVYIDDNIIMASKIYNKKTNVAALTSGGDTVGNFIQFENGVKMYALTTAITADTTTTTAATGSLATTSNATGRGTLYFSDGAKWQKQL